MFRAMKKEMVTYFIIISVVSLGLGLSDSVFANYFKDAYQVTALQRGFIEFPRELPGMLCVFVVAMLSFLGDVRLALVAQALSFVGLVVLGVLTPPFAVMLVFLFINSLGMHLFMPLQDGIGLSLVESMRVAGKRMGQYNGVKTLFTMAAGLIAFVGFRAGWFSFTTPIKWIFLISAGFVVVSFSLLWTLKGRVGQPKVERCRISILFRKEYKFYYILAVLNGVQKQIVIVYAPWILIDLLSQKADTLAMLGIIGSLIGVFFMPAIGRWVDKLGIKKMLFVDALSFIGVYVAYGVLAGFIHRGALGSTGLGIALVFTVFVIDKMSMQMGMIKTLYLNTIARDLSEVTKTLSTGISMDHVVSIIFAYLGGVVWTAWGPQYVFYIAAVFSLINLIVAILVKVPERPVSEQALAGAEAEVQTAGP